MHKLEPELLPIAVVMFVFHLFLRIPGVHFVFARHTCMFDESIDRTNLHANEMCMFVLARVCWNAFYARIGSSANYSGIHFIGISSNQPH